MATQDNVPLSASDIALINKACASLRIAYSSLFNGLVGLSKDDDIMRVQIQLTSLKDSDTTLRKIRHAVQEQPFLTEEQQEDIAALRLTTGQELLDAQNLLTTKAASALDEVPPLLSSIPDLRHEIVGKVNHAAKALDRVYEALDQKSAVMKLINSEDSRSRRR